ncbi:MAG: glycerophosphoryl diester phosphodiesterase [Solirubrobacteraceae bacterium]|nr:glycerophosphoryl diester phosphodiesterase [Solirubrobacteraceae bacterium]
MQVIAHRGASAYAPENSLAAYDLALAQGAHVLELDVRVARDGAVVVVHDPTLARTLGDPRPVAEVPSAELLLLETVLTRYGARTRYLIDLKDPTPAWETRVVDAIERHGLRTRCTVQSFDGAALDRLHRAASWLDLALLFDQSASWHIDVEAVPGHLAGLGPWHPAVDADLVARAHARGLRVVPWTVDDPDEVHRLRGLGLRHVITNRPDVAVAATRAR